MVCVIRLGKILLNTTHCFICVPFQIRYKTASRLATDIIVSRLLIHRPFFFRIFFLVFCRFGHAHDRDGLVNLWSSNEYFSKKLHCLFDICILWIDMFDNFLVQKTKGKGGRVSDN